MYYFYFKRTLRTLISYEAFRDGLTNEIEVHA